MLDPRGGTINSVTGHDEGADMLYIYRPTKYLNDLDHYGTNRNQIDLSLNGNYFAENIIGADHEIRFGVDYVNSDTTTHDPIPTRERFSSSRKRSAVTARSGSSTTTISTSISKEYRSTCPTRPPSAN